MTEKYKKLYKNRGIAMGISLEGTLIRSDVSVTDAALAQSSRQMHLRCRSIRQYYLPRSLQLMWFFFA